MSYLGKVSEVVWVLFVALQILACDQILDSLLDDFEVRLNYTHTHTHTLRFMRRLRMEVAVHKVNSYWTSSLHCTYY